MLYDVLECGYLWLWSLLSPQSALSLRHKYLLAQIHGNHSSTWKKKKSCKKKNTLGFFFFSHFSHNNFPLFIAFLLLQVIIILTRIFTQHVYWQQCAMPQAAEESTIYWLPFPPVGIKRCSSWSHEVPWWPLGWPQWQLVLWVTRGSGWNAKLNLSKTHSSLCLSETFNLCVLCTDCVYT